MAFVCKALIVKHMGLSIHEKEFMAISMVVERWRYIWNMINSSSRLVVRV
jgi:hypothetical protein